MSKALQGIITLDFETYYDRDYSLSKLTTEEYIRDDRFEAIGVSIAFDDKPAHWFTGDHEYIKARLKSLPWDELGLLAHNTMFDAAILNWRFGIRPAALFDTLTMARPLVGTGVKVGLAALAEQFGLGAKGDEVVRALGKRRKDFTKEELAAYGEYCRNDVMLTYKLFKLFLSMGFPTKELKLIDLTLRMFTEPVLQLDKPLLVEHLQTLRAEKKQLLVDLTTHLGRKDLAAAITVGDEESVAAVKQLLRSDAQFAAALEDLGVDAPTKVSPRTGKVAYAFAKTDAGFKALEEHDDPRVQALAAARLGVKTTIEESRTERFLGIADRGTFPIPLRTYGALTFRWSGQDKINMQNLSAAGRGNKHGGKLKHAVKPPPGHMFIDCDSSQIEARVLAWTSMQEDLVEAFREKRDVYSEMASIIYRRPVDRKRKIIDPETGKEIRPDEREGFVGKTTILGAGYGMGGARFKEQLRSQTGIVLPIEETTRIVNVYRDTYQRIPAFWRACGEAIEAMAKGYSTELGRGGLVKVSPEGLLMPNGLTIKYPGLHQRVNEEDGKKEWVYMQGAKPVRLYGGKLTENICQSLARIIIGEQMLRIARRYKVVMTVHDAVGIIAPIEGAREAVEYVEKCMRWIPSWAEGLPLDCESGAGLSYGAC